MTILVATWDKGLFSVTGDRIVQEIAGQPVRGLTSDRQGGALAIVGRHAIHRRSADGAWREIAASEFDLACCVAAGETIFVGTNEAHVLRLDQGKLTRLPGFDAVEGRDRWYAGAAIVDGRLMGPPLGVRSMTCAGRVLLANVHVGGIPRSTDLGQTWQPTIDVEADVHQVCAHPTRPDLVAAASAIGLCISRDAGATWIIAADGLHAPHCSAVAFGGTDVFVSASVDPFSEQGAVYHRPIDGDGPLRRLRGGLPEWLNGKVDTDCLAARRSTVAMIDWSGALYVSPDDGTTWTRQADGLSGPSGLYMC